MANDSQQKDEAKTKAAPVKGRSSFGKIMFFFVLCVAVISVTLINAPSFVSGNMFHHDSSSNAMNKIDDVAPPHDPALGAVNQQVKSNNDDNVPNSALSSANSTDSENSETLRDDSLHDAIPKVDMDSIAAIAEQVVRNANPPVDTASKPEQDNRISSDAAYKRMLNANNALKAFMALQENANNGQDVSLELARLKAAGISHPSIDALSQLETGDLNAEFALIRQEVMKRQLQENAQQGFASKMRYYLSPFVSVTRVDAQASDQGDEAVMSRMADALQEGNLGQFISQSEALSNAAQTSFLPLIDAAKKREKTDAAFQAIRQQVFAMQP